MERLPQDRIVEAGAASREALLLVALAVVALVASDLPYAAGRARDLPGSEFTGIIDLYEDHNQYYSYVRQARDGAWLFANHLTWVPHRPALFNLQWLLVGRCMGWLDLSVRQVHEVWRIGGVLSLVLAIYVLGRCTTADPLRRWVGTFMGCVGGGFGWLFVWTGRARPLGEAISVPWVDVNVAVHPFYQMVNNPHFPPPLAAFTATMATLALAEVRGGRRLYALAALLALLDGLMRPYDVIVLWGVLGLYCALQIAAARRIEWERLILRALPVLATAPLMGYYVGLFRFHPVFGAWYSQSELPPPAWYWSLVSYGLAFVLLAVRLVQWRRFPIRGPVEMLLLSWSVGLFVLMQSDSLIPFSFQLGDPVLPAIFLGVVVLPGLRERGTRRAALPLLLGAALVAAHAPSSAVVVDALARRVVRTERSFLPSAELAAFDWLEQRRGESDLVLCSYETALRLPTYVTARVVVGHYASSPEADRAREEVTAFVGGALPAPAMAALMQRYGADWVFLAPHEGGAVAAQLAALGIDTAYEDRGYRILRVSPAP